MANLGLALALLAASACGRFDFDPLPATSADGSVRVDAAAPGAAPVYIDGDGNSNSAATTLGIALDEPIAAGDLLLVGVAIDTTPQPITIADSTGDTFIVASPGVAGTAVSSLYYAVAATSSPEAVSVSIPSPASQFFQIQLWHYAGIAATAPLDDAAQATGSTTAVDGATTRPLMASTDNELLFAWTECFDTCSAGLDFTLRTMFEGDAAADQVVHAPGAYPATMTLDPGGTSWTVVGATFRGR